MLLAQAFTGSQPSCLCGPTRKRKVILIPSGRGSALSWEGPTAPPPANIPAAPTTSVGTDTLRTQRPAPSVMPLSEGGQEGPGDPRHEGPGEEQDFRATGLGGCCGPGSPFALMPKTVITTVLSLIPRKSHTHSATANPPPNCRFWGETEVRGDGTGSGGTVRPRRARIHTVLTWVPAQRGLCQGEVPGLVSVLSGHKGGVGALCFGCPPPRPDGPVPAVPLHQGPAARFLFCCRLCPRSLVQKHLGPSRGVLGLAPTSQLRPT